MRFETPELKYMAKYFSAEESELSRVKAELEKDDLSFMSVSAVEARFLQFLVSAFNLNKIVEIGSLYGYSALAMGLRLPSDGKIFCFEKDESRGAKIQQNLSGLACEVEIHTGDALENLKKIESEGPFDLIFIDANKNSYCDYLDWSEQNTKKGSIIVGDNTFLFGALWGDSRDRKVGAKQIEIMDLFNKRLSDTDRYHSVMVPFLEGMTIAQRRF